MTLGEFEKKIQNLRRTTSEEMDKRILDDAFEALEESIVPKVYVFPWRTIAAAIIIRVLYLLFTHFQLPIFRQSVPQSSHPPKSSPQSPG